MVSHLESLQTRESPPVISRLDKRGLDDGEIKPPRGLTKHSPCIARGQFLEEYKGNEGGIMPINMVVRWEVRGPRGLMEVLVVRMLSDTWSQSMLLTGLLIILAASGIGAACGGAATTGPVLPPPPSHSITTTDLPHSVDVEWWACADLCHQSQPWV